MTSFVSHYKLWYIIYENQLISPGQIFHVYYGVFFCVLEVEILYDIII